MNRGVVARTGMIIRTYAPAELSLPILSIKGVE